MRIITVLLCFFVAGCAFIDTTDRTRLTHFKITGKITFEYWAIANIPAGTDPSSAPIPNEHWLKDWLSDNS